MMEIYANILDFAVIDVSERESESLLFVCLFAFGVRRLAREPNGNTNNLFIPFHVLHFDAHMYTLSDIHRNTTH
jgi:hypothetical protein